jgi:adenylate cyclase
MAFVARIGADPRDDEELRQKKALLVTIAVIILPISLVWGVLYLGFGSPGGIIAFIYFAVSLGSLVVFARTRRFEPFLFTQLVAILVSPTSGQTATGGFLVSGGVGMWGLLAPLGALVFLDVRQAVRWFGAFLVVFAATGLAGDALVAEADFPTWFKSTMLALNVIGTASIAFTLLAMFARQRNEALTALRAEQQKSELLLQNVLPHTIAERLKVASQRIADHFAAASILFADVVDFTPLAQRLSPADMVGVLDRLFTRFDELVERQGLEKIKTIGDCYMAAAGVPDPCPDHARRAALVALEMQEVLATSTVAGQRRGDRNEPLPLRPLGRRREHRESDGVPWHSRRDPDHARDVRAPAG